MAQPEHARRQLVFADLGAVVQVAELQQVLRQPRDGRLRKAGALGQRRRCRAADRRSRRRAGSAGRARAPTPGESPDAAHRVPNAATACSAASPAGVVQPNPSSSASDRTRRCAPVRFADSYRDKSMNKPVPSSLANSHESENRCSRVRPRCPARATTSSASRASPTRHRRRRPALAAAAAARRPGAACAPRTTFGADPPQAPTARTRAPRHGRGLPDAQHLDAGAARRARSCR